MKNFAQTIATQNKVSTAFPAIKSPAIATDAQIGPQTLFYQTIAVNAGQKYPVQIKGDYVYIEGIVLEISSGNIGNWGNLTVKADTNQTPVIITENYREIQFPEKFNYLEFSNNFTAGTIYLTIYCGFGRARRDAQPRFLNTTSSTLEIGPAVYPIGQSISYTLAFPYATNQATQRGIITKASVIRETTTNTDLTLFLFSKNFTQTPGTNFTFLPSSLGNQNYIGQIRFPNFVAGGAGTSSVCDVADLGINIWSEAKDSSGYPNGTIYGCLVANAATTIPPTGNLFVNLTVQT